jgi:hypothetical protein
MINKSTLEHPLAFKLIRLAAPVVAFAAWFLWSGAAFAAEIDRSHSITCDATTVHAYRDVAAARSWDANDQLTDPSLVLEWRPKPPLGPSLEVDGMKAELVSITDDTVTVMHGFSDPVTVKRWLFAINFGLEDVVGVNVESNVASINGRVAEFACSFTATN